MAERKRKPPTRRRSGPSWVPLLLSYGFGLLGIVGGAMVLVFGRADTADDAAVGAGGIVPVGVGLIVLGVLAIGLTAFLHRSASRKS